MDTDFWMLARAVLSSMGVASCGYCGQGRSMLIGAGGAGPGATLLAPASQHPRVAADATF